MKITMIVDQALHSITRLASILQSKRGWLVGGGIAVSEYFAGHGFTVFMVVAVTLMDAFWGIVVAYKRGEFTLSGLARLTIAKLAVYGSCLFVFIGLDKFIDSVLTASIVGAAIVLVEFWSSCASMLILFPNFLFLRLMKKALIGEIASKLHISEEEAMELMKVK